jgi:DNA-binding IclR family transcriptional regulator
VSSIAITRHTGRESYTYTDRFVPGCPATSWSRSIASRMPLVNTPAGLADLAGPQPRRRAVRVQQQNPALPRPDPEIVKREVVETSCACDATR